MKEIGVKIDNKKIREIYNTSNYNKRSMIVYNKLALLDLDSMTHSTVDIIDSYLSVYKDKRKNVLDPSYISCLGSRDKYNFFVKEYTKESFDKFYRRANIVANDLKESYKYAKKTCDIAALDNKVEKKIFKNSSKYIISGKRTINLKDAKILSRYFLNEDLSQNNIGLYITNATFDFKQYLRVHNLKNNIIGLRDELTKKLKDMGWYFEDEITLNYKLIKHSSTFKSKSDFLYELLTTCFHEARHAYQYKKYTNPDSYTYDDLLMCKENLVTTNINNYYRKNYNELLFELDAEYYGVKKTMEVIKKMDMDIYEKLLKHASLELDLLEYHIKNYRSHSLNNEYYEASESIEKSFLYLFNEHTAKELMNTFPILRYQYHEDGTYKTPRELKQDYRRLIREGKNSKEAKKLYDNLYWNYYKASTNINEFYNSLNNRVSKTKKK